MSCKPGSPDPKFPIPCPSISKITTEKVLNKNSNELTEANKQDTFK